MIEKGVNRSSLVAGGQYHKGTAERWWCRHDHGAASIQADGSFVLRLCENHLGEI